MSKFGRLTAQAMTYLGFVAVVGYLSASPAYHYATAEMATIKLSLSHAADRVEPCVRLTPEQIAELAPNMRHVEQCERERLPLLVRLELDGSLIAEIEAPPSGLWNDGPASVYRRIEVDTRSGLGDWRAKFSGRSAASTPARIIRVREP